MTKTPRDVMISKLQSTLAPNSAAMADELTAAISAAGFVIVPRELTLGMSVAFAGAFFAKRRCIDDAPADDMDWWSAMLAAAEEPADAD